MYPGPKQIKETMTLVALMQVNAPYIDDKSWYIYCEANSSISWTKHRSYHIYHFVAMEREGCRGCLARSAPPEEITDPGSSKKMNLNMFIKKPQDTTSKRNTCEGWLGSLLPGMGLCTTIELLFLLFRFLSNACNQETLRSLHMTCSVGSPWHPPLALLPYRRGASDTSSVAAILRWSPPIVEAYQLEVCYIFQWHLRQVCVYLDITY